MSVSPRGGAVDRCALVRGAPTAFLLHLRLKNDVKLFIGIICSVTSSQ